jgi:hypothetical protein
MQFFGEIDHLKIEAERTDHVDRVVEIEFVERTVELGFIERARVRAPRAREGAQVLDQLERARTRVFAKDVADEGAEVRDARAKRRRGIRFDAGRLAAAADAAFGRLVGRSAARAQVRFGVDVGERACVRHVEHAAAQ